MYVVIMASRTGQNYTPLGVWPSESIVCPLKSSSKIVMVAHATSQSSRVRRPLEVGDGWRGDRMIDRTDRRGFSVFPSDLFPARHMSLASFVASCSIAVGIGGIVITIGRIVHVRRHVVSGGISLGLGDTGDGAGGSWRRRDGFRLCLGRAQQ